MQQDRDIIVSIDVVEPGLVKAVNLLSKNIGRPLKGINLVHKGFEDYKYRVKDDTGLFEVVICDYDNPEELQKTLQPFADRILAITTRWEEGIPHLKQAIPFLPYVNTPTETSLIWATDKPVMRDRLRTYDESLVPKYQYMEREDLPKLEKLIKRFSFPVIVKPSNLWSSYLVTQCNNMVELQDCLEQTFNGIQKVYDRYRREAKPSVLVEEMMQGDMYSTDAYITQKGKITCLPLVKVITAESIGLPGFYSYRHILPTGLPESEVKAALKAAEASVKALNLRSTTAHIEMFQTPQGWKIIEVGARMGGYRDDLYREAYGIEHFYNDLAVRADVQLMLPEEPIKHAAGMNIYADKEGVIESIDGVDDARRLESVVYLGVHAKPGDKALFANNGGELIVDGILSNKDPKKLEADVERVRLLIRIKVKGFEKDRDESKNKLESVPALQRS
jgi:argininosuccinate lyase